MAIPRPSQTRWVYQGKVVVISQIEPPRTDIQPTRLSVNETYEAFSKLPANATHQQVLDFAEEYFVGHFCALSKISSD
jgi:hypothetical protein